MKTPSEDHDLIRWLDGEMNEIESSRFAARLESDPALKAEVAIMQRLSADIRTHLPAEMPVPYGDFFNSQVQVRLAQEETSPLPTVRSSWMDWFRLPTLLTATAAIAIAGYAIWQQASPEDDNSLVHSIYAPNPEVKAHSFHSEAAQATVLMLDGVEEIPADRQIVGYHIKHSETDQEIAATTLYGERGEVLLVVTKDARNQPRLISGYNPRG